MAEFLGNRAPERVRTPGSGFDAMGKPVPTSRRTAALRHCKEMGIADTGRAWECVGAVADQLERDHPYEAMATGMRYLDLTGTYRLMAVLLCDEKAPAPPRPARRRKR